jgi:shikimate kinase
MFIVEKRNVVLIGMPGSGKSTIGRLLSQMLGFKFIDCDAYIERKEGVRLQQIIDEKGAEEFKRIERTRLSELKLSNYVIAPGGSIVYYGEVIRFFKKTSLFVFLNVSLDELHHRIKNITTRGIIGLETKTFSQLFSERVPLYMKYADVVVECNGRSVTAITKEICDRITGSLQNTTKILETQ